MYIYTLLQNVVDFKTLQNIMKSWCVDVRNISIYNKIEGVVQFEAGAKLIRGRPEIQKAQTVDTSTIGADGGTYERTSIGPSGKK